VTGKEKKGKAMENIFANSSELFYLFHTGLIIVFLMVVSTKNKVSKLSDK